MRQFAAIATLSLLFLVVSCSIVYHGFVRNFTSETAIIDVRFLEGTKLTKVPEKVSFANEVVKFKGGYKKLFKDSLTVSRLDSSHVRLMIPPHTSIDLSDITGAFLNAHPLEDCLVTVTVKNRVDTLLNGRYNLNRKLFSFKGGIGTALAYHDIK